MIKSDRTVMETLDALAKDYSRAQSLHLFGSQNYGLQTEASDIDVKVILIPSLEELVSVGIPVNRTVKYENGEICLIDIRSFARELSSINPVSLELVYTPFTVSCACEDAPLFVKDTVRQVIKKAGDGLTPRFARSAFGMIKGEYASVVKAGARAGKSLCNILRICELLKQTAAGTPVSNLNWIPVENRELMLRAKLGYIGDDEMKVTAMEYCNKAENLRERSQRNETDITKELTSLAFDAVIKQVRQEVRN